MISWTRVNELREEIGEEDFAEVADMFMEEVEAVIVRLKAGPALETLEEELHSLKGSALNLGFERLSNLCQIGEQQAAAGETGAIALGEIYETYEQSKRAFSQQQARASPITPDRADTPQTCRT